MGRAMPRDMWDLPQPRIEPMPLALEMQSKPLDHQGSPQPGMGRTRGEAWVLECVCAEEVGFV